MKEDFDRNIGEICANFDRFCNVAEDLPTHLRAYIRCKEDEVVALNQLADSIKGVGHDLIFIAAMISIILLILGGKI